ncbi:hypothetical protein [Scytonema sp. NUACC26]|uniref:hypothetical protein n=1 Tax=Scytonema sp. NUACC26 TaxID=3140176 RepID=UPI0038B414B7
MKNSQVISYRIGDVELQVLRQHQHPGESLNQTAQRLLREALGLSTTSKELSTTPLYTLSTNDVDNRIASQLAPLQEKLNQLETALGEFIA